MAVRRRARIGGAARCRRQPLVALGSVAVVLSGCSLVSTPPPAPVSGSSMAPPGAIGYVVCPEAVTPVELATRTPEPDIRLPISGTPVLGSFAIATSPDGRWAYVVTTDGVSSPVVPKSPTSMPPATARAGRVPPSSKDGSSAPTPGAGDHNVVIPIDLGTQRAEAPITIPGRGGTHAIVVMPNGRTVLAASGHTIVPVDAVTHDVGTPLDLGAGHTVFGMALDPKSAMLYALVAGDVIPVDTATATAGRAIPTGLAVSSVYSPHGIAVSSDGATVYAVGQGGTDFGGRVLPIVASSGATLPTTGFDRFGISDPAALAITADGSNLLVADSANSWVNPIALSAFSDPEPPRRLPEPAGSATGASTQHPTDIVVAPGTGNAYLVEGFDAVVPYHPLPQTFGPSIPVCSGASSMAVAPAP